MCKIWPLLSYFAYYRKIERLRENFLETFSKAHEWFSEKLSLNSDLTNSDENEISLYITNAWSNIQVMGIKIVITKDKKSWYLDKFS